MVMNNGSHRQPDESRIPFREQRHMPQTPPPIAFGKGKSVHTYVRHWVPPSHQFHDQIWDMLRQRFNMQDMPFQIYNANELGAKHPGLIQHHQVMLP